MNINVGPDARGRFWDEPRADAVSEYWEFSFVPPCKVGDWLIFRFDGIAVARAVVNRIELDKTGTFGDKWRVHWAPAAFEDLRGKQHGIPPTDGKGWKHGQGALFGRGEQQGGRGRVL